jgi:hypothetical protein
MNSALSYVGSILGRMFFGLSDRDIENIALPGATSVTDDGSLAAIDAFPSNSATRLVCRHSNENYLRFDYVAPGCIPGGLNFPW